MTRVERELDEFGKRALEPLRLEPPIDPKIMQEEKARFLLHAENLRRNIIPIPAKEQPQQEDRLPGFLRRKISLPAFKALVVGVLLLVLVTVSSFTVYAAQSSLPGDPLYAIKSVSEDIRLSMTISPQAKLDLTLEYTNRRIGEIHSLVSSGKSLPEQTSERYQQELDDALQLAAQMNDQQIQAALSMIKFQAEAQGMTVDELIASLPDQASPAIVHLKTRLQEQVQLSKLGEKDPREFRKEIQEIVHNRHGPKKSPTSDEAELTPVIGSATPKPSKKSDGSEGGTGQSTAAPGHGNQGNGQWQSTPGNGNHGANPTSTP